MTTAVASKVSEAENDQLLWRGPGIQTLGATAFDDLLSSIAVVVAFAQQTGECIGLLGATLEGITLDSPGESSGGSCGRRAPPRRDLNDCCRLAETRRE
jgi:hypothetical protein